MLNTFGDVRIKSVMLTYELLHMDTPALTDQKRIPYIRSVLILTLVFRA